MTATTTAKAERYRIPSHCADVNVSLDEFGDDEIADYLRHRGFSVSGHDHADGFANPLSLTIDYDDLRHIDTLALCGQRDAARALVLAIVAEAIGRPL